MSHVCEYTSIHLEQLQHLVNTHIGSLVPGWALPSEYIASCLTRNPAEYVTDPWVRERKTLIALHNDRVCAAVHLLRYGEDTPARGEGEIDWFVAWPDERVAAASLLAAAVDQLDQWELYESGIGANLPIPVCAGVPETWTYMIELFNEAGYFPKSDHDEAIFGGVLDPVQPPSEPPIPDLVVLRKVGDSGTTFVADFDGNPLSVCVCCSDLDQGGRIPALAGWAELSELETREEWRNKGIGTWLVQHAVQWLVLGGKSRCALSVSKLDERNGAGRFYQRFGWFPFVRLKRGWARSKAS